MTTAAAAAAQATKQAHERNKGARVEKMKIH
jgi:hypothetical protein